MGYVTDEMRAKIGVPGSKRTWTIPLERDSLRRFVQGVMADAPEYTDDEAARHSRFGSLVAPPLYPCHAARRPPGTPDPLGRATTQPDWDGGDLDMFGLPPLDVPLKRLLNGGTEADFFRLLRLGETVTAQSRYVSIEEKQGRSGPLVITMVETEYTNQDGELLARVRNTMIQR